MWPLASSSAAQAPKSSQGGKKERRKEGRERRGSRLPTANLATFRKFLMPASKYIVVDACIALGSYLHSTTVAAPWQRRVPWCSACLLALRTTNLSLALDKYHACKFCWLAAQLERLNIRFIH